MKEKLIFVLLNLVVLLCAFVFGLIKEPHKSDIVTVLVGFGIIIFLIWSFGHGNFKLYRLVKLPNEQLPTKQIIWNFFKILGGGIVVWNLLFQLL
ncbi:MAG: hypothetical protein A2Y98_02730 [Candidatus Portnoybacteria bacterium RBG_19FT_COMBO_36_7]|uniref:Uncharacterized protein n=1 Tax=Candidatus Portnoybacteria bacterium RBG_19FT_COMBO_36_7 TaxID=1801992 RepID=A0A1G2F9X8_9BACT|nr:MAG: hypothetical protein A2Y98_02730 [Candidatus Portnoybacteria bacterium RBG_19FT_COMBO_36_7]